MKRLLAVLPLVLLLSGCPKDPYRAAMQGSGDVAQAVSSGIKLTSQYYAAGTFNDGQKAVAARYFAVVTDCNLTFRKTATDVHTSGQVGPMAFLPVADGFVRCVQIAAPLSNDVKVQNVLKAVDTAIKGIEVAISSAKGK
jgi:hypothetical protein